MLVSFGVRPPGLLNPNRRSGHATTVRSMPSLASPRVVASFAAIYLIWGSTFLAIRWAVETIPPFPMMAARCLVGRARGDLSGPGSEGWAERGVGRSRSRRWSAFCQPGRGSQAHGQRIQGGGGVVRPHIDQGGNRALARGRTCRVRPGSGRATSSPQEDRQGDQAGWYPAGHAACDRRQGGYRSEADRAQGCRESSAAESVKIGRSPGIR